MRVTHIWLAAVALAAQVAAQTTENALNSFLSEAYSVYTEVTSILASDAQNTGTSSTTSSSSSSSSSTTASSSSSSSSSTPAVASSSSSSTLPTASKTTSPASITNAAATSTPTTSPNVNGSHNKLAIILGCVLGALALGFLILVLLICCRRRRRARSSRASSPQDNEIESWRQKGDHTRQNHGLVQSNPAVIDSAATREPPIAEHPAHRSGNYLENPFVPVPPPSRRTAPNAREGLTDGTVPGQEPFIPNEKHTYGPLNSNRTFGTETGTHAPANLNTSHDGHHKGEALAAGVGGAALGAAALHHHNKENEREGDLGDDHRISRDGNRLSREGSILRKPVGGGQPFYPKTTTNDDVYALNKTLRRKSGETGRRSLTGEPAPLFNSAGHGQDESSRHLGTVAAVGAGALSGAALAKHEERRSSKSRSPRRSYDGTKALGPKDIQSHPMPKLQHSKATDSISPASSSDRDRYSDALLNQNTQAQNFAADRPTDIPHPPPSLIQSRPNSALGTAAPAAALGSYSNASNPTNRYNHRRDSTPPAVPSRSPKRTRFSEAPFDTPGNHHGEGSSLRQHRSNSAGGIVGDNGYPLMGTRDNTSVGAEASRVADLNDPENLEEGFLADSSNSAVSRSHSTSDDSTWRLSSGMPGGWSRDASLKNNLDARSPRRHSGSDYGARRLSQSPHEKGRRLRLGDAQREQDERDTLARGRHSMGSEWSGNGGYDGYLPYHHDGGGVGQAM